MAVSRKVLKERLEGIGRWGEYLKRRSGDEFAGLSGVRLRRAVLRGMGLDEDGMELGVVVGDGGCSNGRKEECDECVDVVDNVISDVGDASRRRRGLKARAGEDDISWIYRSMYEMGVRASDAPNVGAWGWLQACREDKALRQDFYRNIWSARVREETERRKRYGDDGREVLERIEVLLKEHGNESGTEV